MSLTVQTDEGLQGIGDGQALRQFVEERDQKAFAVIVRRYEGMVHTVCARTLYKNHELVSDAVQTVFIVLARRAKELIGRNDVGGWLHRTAVYASLRIRQKESRHQQTEALAVREGETIDSCDLTGELDDGAYAALHTAIAELDSRQRHVLVKHFFEKASFDVLANELRVSPDSVRMTAMRARRELRNKLERAGVRLSVAALVTALEREADALPIEESSELLEGIRTAADPSSPHYDVVSAEMEGMDREATLAKRWKIGAVAAGLATIGVGTALVVNHLQSAPPATVATTSWRVESVIGNPSVRCGETTVSLKAGDTLRVGDRLLTSSNQEVRVVSETGDRILVREDSELRFRNSGPGTVEEGRARASLSRRSAAGLPLHLARGAVVAQVKHPARFATPHVGVETSGADFFLMVASGLTSNNVPWSFSRLDVTEGHARFRSFETQVSSFEFPVSSHQFAAVGTDHDGKMIEIMARKSDGREFSPKHGGVFFREVAAIYATRTWMLDKKNVKYGDVLRQLNPEDLMGTMNTNGSTRELVGNDTTQGGRFLRLGKPTEPTDWIGFPIMTWPDREGFVLEWRVRIAVLGKSSHALWGLDCREVQPAGSDPLPLADPRDGAYNPRSLVETHQTRIRNVGVLPNGTPVFERRGSVEGIVTRTHWISPPQSGMLNLGVRLDNATVDLFDVRVMGCLVESQEER